MKHNNKIAILGGSFDPPHCGHLQLAQSALKTLDVDEVVLMPCNEHAFGKNLTPAAQRLEMLNILIAQNKNIVIDDCEIKRQGISHTLPTLMTMQQQNPKQTRYYLLGYDVLLSLNRWPDWEKLFNYCHIVVFSRKGYAADNPEWLEELIKQRGCNDINLLHAKQHGKLFFINTEIKQISATEIRSKIACGKTPPPTEIPNKIAQYAHNKKIYSKDD